MLEGRQPGCVLNRKLSADTLSHILIEDNLLVLGIPVHAKRGMSDDESEGRGGGKKVRKLTDPSFSPFDMMLRVLAPAVGLVWGF